jgi:tetrapyrrole methylase family protein/MazG family protein
LSGELTVGAIRVAAERDGHTVDVIPGVGGLDLVASKAGLDLMADSVQIVDATLLVDWLDAQPFKGRLLPIAPQRPVIVTQVYSREMLSSVSGALSALYPGDHPMLLVGWNDETGGPTRRDTNLLELDGCAVDHLTTVVVPAIADTLATRSPFGLDQVVAHLRSPDGCPWDRELTSATLAPFAVEEAFEVVDAVAAGDHESFADELGDLLLQPFMQAQVAAEGGAFDLADVFEAITDKLIRRHPHVFAEERADSPTAVVETWQRAKEAEGRPPKPLNPYDRLPSSMPASMKVSKVIQADRDSLHADEAGELARSIAAALVRLARSGHDTDRLVDNECRILVDRALAVATRKD